MTLDRIPDLERCFQVNVNVFSLQKDKTVKPVYKSREVFKKQNRPYTMNLNLFENHLSYIKRFHCYAKKVECLLFGRLFLKLSKLRIHERSCDKTTKLVFPGGFHSSPKTIFEKLEELGIQVEQQLRHYPWLIVYDMEALLLKQTDAAQSIWQSEHCPISVCINSNVSEFEEVKFIFDPNVDSLIGQMVDYMTLISDKAYEMSKSRWKQVFDSLEKLERKWNTESSQNAEDDGDANIPENDSMTDSCAETDTVEPPSENFVRAMSKENVYYDFMQRLQTSDDATVRYNDWTDASEQAEDVEEEMENDSDEDLETDLTAKKIMTKLIAKRIRTLL